MSTPIFVSQGKKRYVGGLVSAVNDDGVPVDITGDTFTIALGVSPSVSVAVGLKRRIKLLVDNTTPLGNYYVWGNVVDNPEIEPLVLQGPVVVS
jgi:hypothetical protein